MWREGEGGGGGKGGRGGMGEEGKGGKGTDGRPTHLLKNEEREDKKSCIILSSLAQRKDLSAR